ncbi:MAG: thrombospondin type 3 repeat-containing protein [Acidobacteriota bacterium]
MDDREGDRRSPARGAVGAALGGLALAMVLQGTPAGIIYVDAANTSGMEDGSASLPFNTIQEGINAASAGDTIQVAAGTYREALETFTGVPVNLIGAGAMTTIVDAAGLNKPALLLRSGMTRSHRVEGFTFTGGSGLDRGNAQPPRTAGGGIFVFSSPTITSNIIRDNHIAGVQETFSGGGIYVGVGDPLITQNLIADNTAVPAPGTRGHPTFGIGGGIYVNYFANAEITENTITGNIAGSSTLSRTYGFGGGIQILNGYLGQTGEIDRNTVSGNVAKDFGGGIGMDSGQASTGGSNVRITNNLILDNIASLAAGGGLYTYESTTSTVNNTLYGNQAPQGGGIFFGPTDLSVNTDTLSNNLITLNTATISGGGVMVDPLADPLFLANNFHGNLPSQVEPVDPTGMWGNISADPLFVDGPGGDFHLGPTSPSVDTGEGAGAPAVDREGQPRPADGNNDGVPAFDMGAFEVQPADSDGDGIVDAMDNCPLVVNAAQLDRDGDGAGNLCDADADGDGIANGADCSPLDPVFNAAPGPVGATLAFPERSGSQAAWAAVAGGRAYALYSAETGTLAGAPPQESCSQTGLLAAQADTPGNPAVNRVRSYLVTSWDACGESTAGADSAGNPRVLAAGCGAPGGDTDTDGYPDLTDNCPLIPNTDQLDVDVDGIGDLCDPS